MKEHQDETIAVKPAANDEEAALAAKAEILGFVPIGTNGIAKLFDCTREHVTDRLTKRADFPKPRINQSQKLRYWDRDDIVAYLTQPRRRQRGQRRA